jgi:hypothetical protein
VLTKPDTLTSGASGSRRKWHDIIEGRINAHHLKHGYYCVLLPDDDERTSGITPAESMRKATQFFNDTPPWNNVADRNRFGIPGLVTDISRLLVSLIENK